MKNHQMQNYNQKLYLLSLLLFTSSFFYSQNAERPQTMAQSTSLTKKAGAFIDVNVNSYPASSYTAQQLITDILIAGNTTCVAPNISNVIVSPNTSPTDASRTWGYFNKGTTNFPFDDGLVLVTGSASDAGNSFISASLGGGPTTNPDQDLITAINPLATLNNSTFIQFDFVPSSTQVTFNYIFASEEYTSTFPCGNYSDGFALLIKPVGAATYTNMAILPGGGGPVSVTNIVPPTYSCGPINATYFAGHNTNNIETNFSGRTIPLTATATVIPGQAYTFKMVIADASDSSYNSAVFIEGGSFDIGLQIVDPGGVALPSVVEMCDNSPQTIVASVQMPGATYQWYYNGQAITGATSASYVANQPGKYCLKLSIPGNQCPVEACIEIIGGTSPSVQNVQYTQCYGPGDVIFNLEYAQPYITSTPGVSYSYYNNLADAQAQNSNTINNVLNYTSAGNETIYAVVKSGFCPKIAEIELIKADEIIVDIAQPASLNCSNTQIVLNASSSVYPSGSVFNWVAENGGYVFSGGNTLTPIISSGGTYTLTISKYNTIGDITCRGTASVVVVEDFTPPAVSVSASDYVVCAGYPVVLSAIGGQSYIWSHNADSTADITVNPTQTTTYTVYAVGVNGCQSSVPADITIEVIPTIPNLLRTIAGRICTGDEIVLDAGSGHNYTYVWNYLNPNGTSTIVGNTQTVTVNQIGKYSVTIDNGECQEIFETEIVSSELPLVNNADFDNGKLTISANNPSFENALEYSIDGGFTWQDSPVFNNVLNNTTIPVLIRIKNTKCVSVFDFFTLHIQNVITPNGDGINDELDFSAISRFEDFEAIVYDRYGKKIWEGSKSSPIWDGRFQGRALSTNTYWYDVKYTDPNNKSTIVKKGWVLLKNRE